MKYTAKWSVPFHGRLAEANSFDVDVSCFGEQGFGQITVISLKRCLLIMTLP